MKERDRLAAPVMMLYWLMVVGGLGVYTAIRSADAWSLTPLWIGAITGTAIGQALALRDFRGWVVVAVLFTALCWGLPHVPDVLAGKQLWMAFVPATLCGFWSLGDRASLLAFWFPTVIWMLSILDRTDANSPPDRSGVVLLGGLAVLFIVFLRLRESRRIGLWSTISATPLATTQPSEVLKEPPGRPLARAGWALVVSAITFSLTAWIAPHLWHAESFDGDDVAVSCPASLEGLPCCSAQWEADTTTSRVKEYFDIGRGHETVTSPPREGLDCRACDGGTGETIVAGGVAPIDVYGGTFGTGVPAADPPPHIGDGRWRATPGVMPTRPHAVYPPVAPPSAAFPETAPITVDPPAPPTFAPPHVPEPSVPAPAIQDPPPPPVVAPNPIPAPQIQPPPPPPVIPAPAPTPAAKPTAVASTHLRAPAATPFGPSLIHWLVVIVAAALLFQIVQLALRPLRRLIVLRHLRRPFWDETVDQRVSNSWQLALVGLRDAGWRSTSDEAPREFARRTGVDGVERCATILERARHGIAIDAEDLSEMGTSADAAYRSARSRAGGAARMISWIRWPLA